MGAASREPITVNRGVVVWIQVWRGWAWLPSRARRHWPSWRNCMTSIRPRDQVTVWKAQLLDGAAGLFSPSSTTKETAPAVDLKTLHAKIGELP
jgi:hypothetical protein